MQIQCIYDYKMNMKFRINIEALEYYLLHWFLQQISKNIFGETKSINTF